MARIKVDSRYIHPAGAKMLCGSPIYLDASSVWQKAAAGANDATHILTQDCEAGDSVEGLEECSINGYTGLTIGGLVYLSATAGEVTQVEPSPSQIIGRAVSTTEIQFVVESSAIELAGITGVQGLTGYRGITGAQGLQGVTGANGVQGITGAQGIQGITGEQGLQGLTGEAGLQGETGLQGLTGVDGITGLDGLQGLTGEAGLQGITGANGVQGLTGIQGITGVNVGSQATGIAGITGTAPTADEFNTMIAALKAANIMAA